MLHITSDPNLTPTIGDIVAVTWDYDSPQELKNQAVELISLSFDGQVMTAVSGCLPGIANNQPCMPNNKRSSKFKFLGTTTVCVYASDTSNYSIEKCYTLHPLGLSFSGELSFINPGYPLYDGELETIGAIPVAQVVFDKSYGIYQDPSAGIEDGHIDQLLNNPIFSSDQPYFGSSTNVNENPKFGFSLGSEFPGLQAAYLNSSDGGKFTQDNKDNRHYANFVIFAGVIPLPGTVDKTTNSGNSVTTVPIGFVPKPFFVQIDVVTGVSKPYIIDTHMGCIPQGLVLSSFPGFSYADEYASIPEYDLSISTGSSSGWIKGAHLAFNVTTESGVVYKPAQAGMNLYWKNVPLYPDTNINTLFANPFVDNEFDDP